MYRRMGGTDAEYGGRESGDRSPTAAAEVQVPTTPAPIAEPLPSDDPRVAELARMLPPPIRQPLAVKRTIETVTRPKEPAE
jgi:hypothetical protein